MGLFKTEVIRQDGPWRGLEEVESATLEWVASFNTTRLLEPLGYLPPAAFEAQFHRTQSAHVAVGALTYRALRKTRGDSFPLNRDNSLR